VSGRQDARKWASSSGPGIARHEATESRSSEPQSKAAKELTAVHAEINLGTVHRDSGSEWLAFFFRVISAA
jgi:hypothetical protein